MPNTEIALSSCRAGKGESGFDAATVLLQSENQATANLRVLPSMLQSVARHLTALSGN